MAAVARPDVKSQAVAMDDFLFDASKSNYACNSIEDLQLQLAELRQAKVTDTKAEHISATFEFRSTSVFNVPENENDGADANQNLDPTLGGSPAMNPHAPEKGNGDATPAAPVTSATREIRAHDTLMNQPADDPALQKAVARLIITSLGFVDGSAWTVRSVSRGASGWTFQYLCRNSTQAWQRQNSKNTAKVLVGESSGKDGQDPVNLGEQYPRNYSFDRCLANHHCSPSCFRLSWIGDRGLCQEQPNDNGQA